MKEIEVNSDKITASGVVFLLALALFGLFFDLHALASHRSVSDNVRFWDYPVAIFILYIAADVCRNPKLRKNYPFGVAGVCLLVLTFLLKLIAHWENGSPETWNLLSWSMTALEIVAWSLILVEGVRWFRKIVVVT
jgi:uncharacterized membrane protein